MIYKILGMDLNLDDLLDLIYPPSLDEHNAANEIEIIIEPFCTNEREGRSFFIIRSR